MPGLLINRYLDIRSEIKQIALAPVEVGIYLRDQMHLA
jgi:hypothetical protein